MGFNPGSGSISGATDVAFSNPTNNQVLTYDSTLQKWKNATSAAGGSSADSVADVISFGAVGNGTTDDSPALQAALNSLPSTGGTIRFEARTYRLATCIQIDRDNLTVDFGGATIVKQPSDDFDVMMGRSFHGTGYKGGPQHCTIKNGKFKGSFTTGSTRGIGFHFHHAQDLTFDNVHFVEGLMGGHYLDLAGCSRVNIVNSIFEGSNTGSTNERNEAIQLDYSYLVGTDIDSANTSRYDGLGCNTVLIDNCKFVPLSYQVNATTYGAPNPVGGHTRVQNAWIENVTFSNNLIQLGKQTYDQSVLSTRGWIHFFHARNLSIVTNTFVCKSGVPCMAIQLEGSTGNTAYGINDIDNANATQSTTITPQPPSEIDISNNTFIGFNGANTEPIISVKGYSTTLSESLAITRNKFRGCHPTNANTPTSQVAIEIENATGVVIADNQADSIGQLVHTTAVINQTVSKNTVAASYSETFLLSGGGSAVFEGNTAVKCSGGVRFNGGSNIVCKGNVFTYGSATNAVKINVIEFSGSPSNFICVENIVNGTGAAKGINASPSTVRGLIANNISLGATAPVAVDAGATNIKFAPALIAPASTTDGTGNIID